VGDDKYSVNGVAIKGTRCQIADRVIKGLISKIHIDPAVHLKELIDTRARQFAWDDGGELEAFEMKREALRGMKELYAVEETVRRLQSEKVNAIDTLAFL
jgi:hypothetical protein